VTWKPVRASGATSSAVWTGTGATELQSGLGPCVIIHLDKMPHQAPMPRRRKGSTVARWKARLVAPAYSPPPPWEEHIGVVDHRTALRTASDHGVTLEIL
jgi:hypothetical protein